MCNETHRVDDYNSAWETFMAPTRTIVKKPNLVLWSVVCKDLEPRCDGLLRPHQYLRLGPQLSSVCDQGVAMLCDYVRNIVARDVLMNIHRDSYLHWYVYYHLIQSPASGAMRRCQTMDLLYFLNRLHTKEPIINDFQDQTR